MTKPNPFDILDLSPSLQLSMEELNEAYHRVLLLTHPDRFVGKTGAEKIAASLKAAEANEAYQKLKHFYSRCCACLEAFKVSFDENKAPSPDFLMEVMTFQEGLEEGNASVFPEIETAFHEIKKLIEASFSRQAYGEVCEGLSRYKYLERLSKRAQELSLHSKKRVA